MNKPILIIAAMEDVELKFIIEKIETLNKVTYKGFNFFEGKLSGKEVVLCESKIGLINSAAAVTIRNRKVQTFFNNKFRFSRGIYKRYSYRRYYNSELML